MKRILIDYKKLNNETVSLLIENYPYGYGDDDIIAFKNLKGEIVETVELKTKDTLYLVKISKSLSNFIANFDDTIEKELETKPDTVSEDIYTDSSVLEVNIEHDFGEEVD